VGRREGRSEVTPVPSSADCTGFADTPAYRNLLRQAADGSMPRAGAEHRIVDYRVLMEEPDRYRGKPVLLRGNLFGISLEDLETNGGAVEVVAHGMLCDRSADHAVAISAPRSAMPRRVEDRSLVEVEGIFHCVVRYEARAGWKTVPWVIARNVADPWE